MTGKQETFACAKCRAHLTGLVLYLMHIARAHHPEPAATITQNTATLPEGSGHLMEGVMMHAPSKCLLVHMRPDSHQGGSLGKGLPLQLFIICSCLAQGDQAPAVARGQRLLTVFKQGQHGVRRGFSYLLREQPGDLRGAC